MVELPPPRALVAGVAAALLMSACGGTRAEIDSQESSSPEIDGTAESRAEGQEGETPAEARARKQARQEQEEERCAELRRSVKVTYRVISRPVAEGKEITLRITIRNDTTQYVGGPFGGILRVTEAHPGQPRPMNWGGSSADEAGVRAQGTFVHQVLNLNGEPLRTPADARITDVDLDYTNLQLCQMPARVRAPRGLVAEHPSGHWYVTPEGDEITRPAP